MSSWTSLNAEASNTTAKGSIVVYRFVGETPGICWIHAVNRKNKLAYFENCSADLILDHITKKYEALTSQEFGHERSHIIFARADKVRTVFHIHRCVVESNDPIASQLLLLLPRPLPPFPGCQLLHAFLGWRIRPWKCCTTFEGWHPSRYLKLIIKRPSLRHSVSSQGRLGRSRTSRGYSTFPQR